MNIIEFDTGYGVITLEVGYISPASFVTYGEPSTQLKIEEPYRESYGHSASITPTIARKLAAELIAFADRADLLPTGGNDER